jgi:conjugal transfer pilus assembly protein TraE
MQQRHYVSQLQQLTLEKKCYLIAMLLLASVVLIETLFLVFTQKQERTVIVPMQLAHSFWVDEKTVSASYLTEMARFIASSVLTVTPESVETQEANLLRFTYPAHRGQLQHHWQAWRSRIESEKVSHVFIPEQVEVDMSTLSATVTGELITFMGREQLQQVEASYLLGFIYHNGRLWLSQLAAVEKQGVHHDKK